MHPFERIPRPLRVPMFVAMTFIALASSAGMMRIGAPLTTPAAPLGIVSYEFAWDKAGAESILDSWEPVRGAALQSLIIDYGYMVVYSCAIALGCILAAQAWLPVSLNMGVAGRFLAWAQWIAAGLDAIENGGLLAMFWGYPSTPAAQVAFWCAALKFLIIAAGLIYALSGLAARLFPRHSL